MYERFTILFAGMFLRAKEAGRDPFWLLGTGVAMELLNDQYRMFVKEGIIPLESLPPDQKQRYWELSKRYQETQDNRIQACKVAYTLELITDNK